MITENDGAEGNKTVVLPPTTKPASLKDTGYPETVIAFGSERLSVTQMTTVEGLMSDAVWLPIAIGRVSI